MHEGNASGGDLTSGGGEVGAGVIGAIAGGVVVVAAGLVAAGWWLRKRKLRAKQGAAPVYTTGPVMRQVESPRESGPNTIPTPQSCRDAMNVQKDFI